MNQASVQRRPFPARGVLIQPVRNPRDAGVIFPVCEEQLLQHLAAVCLWPEAGRNRGWRDGDASFYVLEFSPASGIQVYAQVMSEAGKGAVLLEVSSGARDPAVGKFVDAGKRRLLREHGFEAGGEIGDFCKSTEVANLQDVHAVARELMAILTTVMGYDGTQELRYQLALNVRVVAQRALRHIGPDALARLLNAWRFMAEAKREDGQPPRVEAYIDGGQLEILFDDETWEGSDEYQALTLRGCRRAEDFRARERADRLNQALARIKCTVDDYCNIVVEQRVPMYDGVTFDQLREQLHLVRRIVSEIGRRAEPRGRPLTEEEREDFARRRLEAALGGDVDETLTIKYEEYEILHGHPRDFWQYGDWTDEILDACLRVGVPLGELVSEIRVRFRKWLQRRSVKL